MDVQVKVRNIIPKSSEDKIITAVLELAIFHGLTISIQKKLIRKLSNL